MLARSFAIKVLRMQGDTLNLQIPKLSTKLDFSVNETLEDVETALKLTGVRNIEFLAVDGVRFSRKTSLSDLKRSAFVIKVDNLNFKILPEHDTNPLELSSDFLETCGLPFTEVQILSQHMQRLSSALQVLNRQEFSKDELHKAIASQLPAGHPQQEKPEQLRERYVHLEEELRKANSIEEFCQKKAARAARRRLWLGLGILGLQWGYIATGTFVYFSWDVMEPQAYLIGLGNLILGVSYYVSRRHEFALSSVFNLLKQRKFLKYSDKYKLDLTRLKQLKTEVARLKQLLYKTK